MAPLPVLTLPSRAVLAATDMKDLTAKNQRQRTDAGIDLDQIVHVMGYTTPGDCEPIVYKRVAAAPSHAGYVQSACGQYWELVPNGTINARHFGLATAGSAADNTTALQNWAAYINAGSFKRGIIPPGQYQVNGGIGFTVSRFHVSAHGAEITQNSTTAVTVDLNSGALANESVITSYITWEGGRFIHAVPYATTANTATAIRARGITRCTIANVEVEDFGTAFALNPRDALSLRDCHGFQNNVHVHVEDWQTVAGNPQDILITGCAFSVHYDACYLFEGAVNQIHILGGYCIGSRAVVAENATSASSFTSPRNLIIDSLDCEQGAITALTGTWTLSTGSATITAASDGAATTEITAQDRIFTAGGRTYTVSSVTDDDTIVLTAAPSANESSVTIYQAVPYIDIRDTNGGTLRNVVVDNCAFAAFSGASTLAHVMHCRSVTNVSFENNYVSNRAPGWLWFDSSCSDVGIENITETGTANYIHHDCGREAITHYPEIIDFPAYNGSNGNLIHNNAALSDADSATVDLSATIAAGYYPTIIHPKGVTVALSARDSGSAAAAAGACYLAVLPTSGTSTGERFRYATAELSGLVDDRYSPQVESYVPCDDNGDFYVAVNATGTGTLDAYVTVKRLHM